MSKQRKKKRNKAYQGADASPVRQTVHRYRAVKRSAFSEWWGTNGRAVKIISAIVGVVVIGTWFVIETLRILF